MGGEEGNMGLVFRSQARVDFVIIYKLRLSSSRFVIY